MTDRDDLSNGRWRWCRALLAAVLLSAFSTVRADGRTEAAPHTDLPSDDAIQFLVELADLVRRSLPIDFGDGSTLTDVQTDQGSLTYIYSVDSSRVDTNEFHPANRRAQLVGAACGNDGLVLLMSGGINIRYRYYVDGSPFVEIGVSESDCGTNLEST